MVSVERVTNQFFNGRSSVDGPQSSALLGPGLISADYGDADHVFLVCVTRVPRLVLRFDPPIEVLRTPELSIRLTRVETSNYVAVACDVEATGIVEARLPVRGLTVRLRDNAGTVYEVHAGEDGGSDNPHQMIRRFRPLPPAEADTLTISIRIDGQEPVSSIAEFDLPLTGGHLAI